MNYQPLVTIVIPVYNGTNFMKKAIDCALEQTYKRVEVIVINDGSTDDGATDFIAKSYGDKIIYINKENGGVSSALNLAIEKMHGEWLSWLSHDDLYYPNKIEKQISFINKLIDEDPSVDINKIAIHCATESIDKFGKVIKTPSYSDIQVKENTLDTIIGNVYNYRLSGCSFLLPAACFNDVGGFREDIRTVSDVEFWYRLLFHGYQFYCMKNDILVKNRSHGKQVGKTKVSLFEKELNELHIAFADQLANEPEFYNPVTMKKFYFGLVKRSIYSAADYTKMKYLKNTVSRFDYSLLIPIRSFMWRLVGVCRNIARIVFRKLRVR